MTFAARNYLTLLDEVAEIAQRCGRNPAEITVVAVSKGHNWSEAAAVYDAGCRDFGESRLQESIEKIVAAPKDARWHFIGSLQKNKAARAVASFDLIHSVDSFELAAKISEASLKTNKRMPILLQANISGEASKHGLSGEQWKGLMDQLLALEGISLMGLMTMAPFGQDEKIIRKCFSGLRDLKERLKAMAGARAPLKDLSMGMSNDFRYAIEEGATLLRIGSAIFEYN